MAKQISTSSLHLGSRSQTNRALVGASCQAERGVSGQRQSEATKVRSAAMQHGEAERDPCGDYRRLWESLEKAAAVRVEEVMAETVEMTEPFVAFEVAKTLPAGDALFVGNSMPIRDMDSFGGAQWKWCEASDALMSHIEHGLGAPIAANRGASGIDGIISTAAGYAFGLRRAVTLVIGDVSFLHDVNGLNLLRTGEMRPPVTIVLINNGGGGIFDFLPIAQEVPQEIFTQLWSTPQNVDLAGICRAHGLAHQRVTQPGELVQALGAARGLNKHSIVEVITSRQTNVAQHRSIQESVKVAVLEALTSFQAAEQEGLKLPASRSELLEGSDSTSVANSAPASPATDGTSDPGHHQTSEQYIITEATYYRYQLPLSQQLTSDASQSLREGLVLQLSIGQPEKTKGPDCKQCFAVCGEIAPLPGLHRENLHQAEMQTAMLCQLLRGAQLDTTNLVPEVDLACWLRDTLGLDSSAFAPSLLFGLEAAILSAASQVLETSTASLLQGSRTSNSSSETIAVNGLMDCSGSPAEAAARAVTLIQDKGYRCLKVKVARKEDLRSEAEALLAIRQAVGPSIALRADANQRWSLQQAVAFAQLAFEANLEYLEEPVKSLQDLQAFSKCCQMPIALDETLDKVLSQASSAEEALRDLQATAADFKATAVVIKPSLLRWGPSFAVRIAKSFAGNAKQHPDLPETKVIISSAFESDLGLALGASLAAAIQQYQPRGQTIYHGLGTGDWLEQGITKARLISGSEILMSDAVRLISMTPDHLKNISQPQHQLSTNFTETVTADGGNYAFTGKKWEGPSSSGHSQAASVIFLHGFLGHSADWDPITAALSLERDCFALNLPGHGSSYFQSASAVENGSSAHHSGHEFSIAALANATAQAIKQIIPERPVILVAYSLGARIALQMLVDGSLRPRKTFLVSATCGIEGLEQRQSRAEIDDGLAEQLRKHGLEAFTEDWYRKDMWQNFVANPRSKGILEQRCKANADQTENLARLLSQASPGRAKPLWSSLANLGGSICLCIGEHDHKYRSLATDMEMLLGQDSNGSKNSICLVKDAGHAVHVEHPELLVNFLHASLNGAE